ncbi:unnamed protein product [Orchesella dallaii]|uniref:Protein Wnt n=1 Tax=Orchesella dallaii TaxID=48710 RepID=A0ABP1RCU7_9HEXA
MFLRVKTTLHHFTLLLFVAFLSNLGSGVLAHWINLHLWHDDLYAPDPLASTSLAGSNGTTVSSPGGNFDELPNCQDLDGLTEAQSKLCLLFFDHMRPVILGAKLGLSECQWQFRHHHWNCSSSAVIQSRVLRENKPASSFGNSGNGNYAGEMPLHPSSHSESYHVGSDDSTPIFQQGTLSKKQKQQSKMTSVLTQTSGKRLLRPAAVSIAASTSSSLSSSHPRSSNHYVITKEKTNWNTVLTRGSKEVAFAHAIWSAAVTDAVARACRDGSLTSCGCGKTPRPPDLRAEWRWGGCGDNLQYGYKFAQSFVDIREQESVPLDKKAKARSLVNLHNNEAGRRAVLKKTKIACKCHGVSGSCALVTCWHQIPSFREIGDHLKDRYVSATQVKLNKRGRLQVRRSGVRVPSVFDLVFMEQSPNYCVQNETLGIFGNNKSWFCQIAAFFI